MPNVRSQLDIKPVTESDIPALLALIKELADYEHLSHLVTATEKTLKETLLTDNAPAKALLGINQQQPVGFALYFYNYSSFLARPGLYIEDIYIQPGFRRQGFGKQLFLYLARLAKEQECGRLEWAVLNWNEPAINFYKKLGGEPQDEWTTYRIMGENLDKLG
jgi:GNAT superfamily N-acetyltransferase